MRNTALILGILSGLWGMVIGFFSGGYIAFVDWFTSIGGQVQQVDNATLVILMGLIAPILALVGGGMVHSYPKLSGPILLLSASGMYYAFDWRFFTQFPIALCAIGGVLALIAGFRQAQ